MKYSLKVMTVFNTEIPQGYMPENKAFELEENCKDVLFELIYPKKTIWASEVRNYVELESFSRVVEILEAQKWSNTIKYALHAARILAALPEEKPRVRHIIGVWRAKN